MQIMHSTLGLLGILLCATSTYAGTYYRLTVPNKSSDYCETMPFDFVHDDKITQPYVPITVNQPVTLTFTNPRWWFFSQPVTGMVIWSPKGIVKPKKISEQEYQYHLQPLKSGEMYIIRGNLQQPSSAFKVCVTHIK